MTTGYEIAAELTAPTGLVADNVKHSLQERPKSGPIGPGRHQTARALDRLP
jgi:hypothetical protein